MAHDELATHSLELLQPLGAVRSRRMFGGHGIYLDDLFFGLIADDRLFLKVDERTRPVFEGAGCEPFVYDGKGKRVAMGYFSVPADAMESPALMQPWARLALEAALRARAAKKPAAPRKTMPAKTVQAKASSRSTASRAKTGRGKA